MTQRLLVGTRKGLFVWSRGSSGWTLDTVHFLGEPVTMVLEHPADRTLYATLTLGHFGSKLRRLSPGATEWEECGVPVFPEGSEVNAGPPTGDGTQNKKPASLMEIWSLEAAGNDDAQSLWGGMIPGGLFHSADRGQTWQLVESLWNREERSQWFGGGKDDPGIHSIAVDPRDSRRLTLAVSCGGAWFSEDAGATWGLGQGMRAEYMPPNLAYDPVTQDPHRLASCAAAPDTMWIQHHNGIFLSRDAGRTWRELTTARPSSFGFAVVAHPKNPDIAWFAPAADDQCRTPVDAKMVVSRTRDGGETFEVLGRGLPDHQAYDIVYRHGLDVDETGEVLAVGSTTGGLWANENSGDDWTCLSHTLPPVYCIRFAA